MLEPIKHSIESPSLSPSSRHSSQPSRLRYETMIAIDYEVSIGSAGVDSDVEVNTILEGLETMIVTHMASEGTNSSQRRNLREEIRRFKFVKIDFVGPRTVKGQFQSYHTYIPF